MGMESARGYRGKTRIGKGSRSTILLVIVFCSTSVLIVVIRDLYSIIFSGVLQN